MQDRERQALSRLEAMGDCACYEDMVQTIVRGQAQVIAAGEEGVLLRHRTAELCMIAANTYEDTLQLAEMIKMPCAEAILHGCPDEETARQIGKKLGFAHTFAFDAYAYYGEMPSENTEIDMRVLGEEHIDFLYENYGHASREYVAARARAGVMLGAYVGGELAAFIGEHAEGSVGLLHVMPAYRRKGIGFALEREAIRQTMLRGYRPFGQVYPENTASHALQRRLGMTKAEGRQYWLTNDDG